MGWKIVTPQYFHKPVPFSLVILIHIVGEITVVIPDGGVIVKLVEELGSIIRVQPIGQYSFVTKKIYIVFGVDEVIHQNGVGCYLVQAIVVALFKGDEVPEQRLCPLINSQRRNCKNPFFELYVHYAPSLSLCLAFSELYACLRKRCCVWDPLRQV